MNSGSDFILFLGKIFVTLCSAIVLLFNLNSDPRYDLGGEFELTSHLAPFVVVMLIAFFVSSGFFHVFETITATELLCFCYEEARSPFLIFFLLVGIVFFKKSLFICRNT